MLPGSATAPFRNLTVIEGSPIPRAGLSVGVTLEDEATRKALRLMDIIKQANILRKHALTKIDITDPKNIILFVDGVIEIRMGGSHFVERLKILDQTLRTVELNPSKISYIDLRFDDIVVGPK